VLDASSAPTLTIDNANGTFRGTRHSHDGAVTIAGTFSADAKTMFFTVKTSGTAHHPSTPSTRHDRTTAVRTVTFTNITAHRPPRL
jgi:hypothetical protein